MYVRVCKYVYIQMDRYRLFYSLTCFSQLIAAMLVHHLLIPRLIPCNPGTYSIESLRLGYANTPTSVLKRWGYKYRIYASKTIRGPNSLRKRITLHRSHSNIPKKIKVAFSQHPDICANNKNPYSRIFPSIN